jgi:hypothetical protein
MKIINKGVFYFGTDGTAYRGTIELSQKEFDKALKSIAKTKKIDEFTKNILIKDIQLGKVSSHGVLYALRVTITDYIVVMFENTSRYNYKRQNYIIKVK